MSFLRKQESTLIGHGDRAPTFAVRPELVEGSPLIESGQVVAVEERAATQGRPYVIESHLCSLWMLSSTVGRFANRPYYRMFPGENVIVS